ncbi:hypothetical protein ELI41_29785 (plasmid) [Rhizobium leguminosarum]|nr:hypothetical protein ELI41_29785 [Rhizobium leguminosarum]TAV53060.1 hypothetical protein ELI29_08105 [Rhizobium leguminosarum]
MALLQNTNSYSLVLTMRFCQIAQRTVRGRPFDILSAVEVQSREVCPRVEDYYEKLLELHGRPQGR